MKLLCLTRFNIEIASFDKSKERKCLDETYLSQRFDLFERYTLPSMMAQTDMDYIWLVLFHRETSSIFKKKIDSYVQKYPQFCPLYLDAQEGERYVSILSDYIRKKFPNEQLITIRLDNDDMLCSVFIEYAKNYFIKNKHVKVLSLLNGLQYEMNHSWLVKYRYPCNHFLCMNENASKESNNILCFDHSAITELFTSEELTFENNMSPMWVEIISGTNVINSIEWSFKGLNISREIKGIFPFLPVPWESGISQLEYSVSLIPLVIRSKFKKLWKKLKGR